MENNLNLNIKQNLRYVLTTFCFTPDKQNLSCKQL